MAKRGQAESKPSAAHKKAAAPERLPTPVEPEVTQLKRELNEALQRQIATADVLKVISRSTFDLQTVLDTLTESAAQLCDADMATITRQREPGFFYHVTNYNFPSDWLDYSRAYPLSPSRGSGVGRALLERKAVQIPDVLADPEYAHLEQQKKAGFRTFLCVPMLRNGEPIGVLTLSRKTVRTFTDKQIELVTTFADQAAIAIENVRLFDEVQARTRDLSEALVYQTGSSNILRVIASSPTDVGPVLKSIVDSACELCNASDAVVLLKDGDHLRFSAHHGPIPVDIETWPINRNWTVGRAFLDRKPVHVRDLLSAEGDEFPDGRELSRRMGHRSILSVPLLRENESIGVIVLRRNEVHPYSDKQIGLLQTFADQAVIAIGNVHLFEQVQEQARELSLSLDELRAAQDRLVQTEKLASLGQLTAGIAHEIKNPLNFVNNFAALSEELIDELHEMLERAPLDQHARGDIDELTQTLKSNLQKVVQHGKRADSIVKNMLLHSREGAGERRTVDINAIVDESVNLAYHGARAERSEFNIVLRRDFDPGAGMVDLYPQEMTRVFLNLITNGFYAATKRKIESDDAMLTPTLSAATKNLGDKVEIRIRDNGTGIPPGVKEKMFNPFFTTKPAGEGTGLGLSMSHDIVVKQHGGRIDVDTEPGAFTEFVITLPRRPNKAEEKREMIFRQLFDQVSGTYSYLLASRKGGEALIIDPVLEKVDRYLQLVHELDLKLVKAVDTHMHADHITGLGALRDKTHCVTVMGEQTKADVVSMRLADGDKLTVEGLSLDAIYTPGHTDDSYSFIMADRVFTGDTLLIRGTGRTDFQNGDPRAQYESLFGRLLKLPEATLVFPAHDYKGDSVSTIGEEKAYNPRLQVKSVEEYVALMNNLKLSNPKMMDVAVPANMKVGLHQEEIARRGWAVTAVQALALTGKPDVALIDLRERFERERHGFIPGGLQVPYTTLQENIAVGGTLHELAEATGKRLLFYCAFGERSAMAVQAAQDAGLTNACHIEGGIDAWKKADGPVAHI